MMNSTKESLKMDSKKSKKPQMEKLRRARINESLNELKSLVLDAMKKDVSRYSKMEKADILEMTVKYLRESKDKQPKSNSDSLTIANYRAGFNECAAEVARYLMSLDNVSDELRAHLLSHLSSYYCSQTQPMKWTGPRANGVSYPAQMVRVPSKVNPFSTFPIPTTNSSEMTFPSTQPSPPSSPLNQQEAGLMRIKGTSQVILSNGMPALLVPNDGVKLLPLTWQSTHPAAFQDSQSIWRPFTIW